MNEILMVFWLVSVGGSGGVLVPVPYTDITICEEAAVERGQATCVAQPASDVFLFQGRHNDYENNYDNG